MLLKRNAAYFLKHLKQQIDSVAGTNIWMSLTLWWRNVLWRNVKEIEWEILALQVWVNLNALFISNNFGATSMKAQNSIALLYVAHTYYQKIFYFVYINVFMPTENYSEK